MSPTRPFATRRSPPAILAGVLLLWASTSLGQNVTEMALKAAFIYNFAKFAVWPQDVLPAEAPLRACVLGDLAVSDALERTVKGRIIDGHSIGVLRVSTDTPLQPCHLLYLTGMAAGQAIQIAADLRELPILTIGDVEDFARLGGIVQFFLENGKMRFNINQESLKRSRIRLGSWRWGPLAPHHPRGPTHAVSAEHRGSPSAPPADSRPRE